MSESTTAQLLQVSTHPDVFLRPCFSEPVQTARLTLCDEASTGGDRGPPMADMTACKRCVSLIKKVVYKSTSNRVIAFLQV